MSRGPYPILLMLAMSMPSAVRAIGLGEIRVDSALNEPLSAQIDIVGATREELVALTATVASRDVFQRYGVDRPSFLASATFKVGLDAAGHPVLNVRSADAFTDPVVSLLVDLRWGKNDVVREYSLLLDPPGYAYPRPASDIASAAPAPRVVAAPVAGLPVAAPPATVPALPAASSARAQPAASALETASSGRAQIRVAAGDTLRAIARHAGASTAAQAQTLMIAIFRANSTAFEGNINRLHRGAVLTIPTTAECAAISSAEARREVRAQMTAWRLDGRPAASHAATAVADTSAAPAQAGARVPDALQNRVQTLELALDDLHKQLASEDAKIQGLKRTAATEPVAEANTAMPGSAVAAIVPAASASPAPVATAPTAPAESPAVPAAPAELVNAPIIAPSHPAVAVAAMAPASRAPRSAEFFGPVALALGLLVAGIAFFRRRAVRAVEIPSYGAEPAAVAEAPTVTAAVAPPTSAPPVRVAMTRAPSVASVSASAKEPAQPAAALSGDDMSSLFDAAPLPTTGMVGTELVDIEALERSYLESLPIDPSAIETTTVETLGIEATVALPVGIEATVAQPAPKPDFNLADLDATAQHVHMPSALHDSPVTSERRTNIVDVLKLAIERDPNRRDLRMKLLETYYSLASTNQRAFLEVVRKLSREKDSLSSEDWQKVMMMGREIAADDIFFAEIPGAADLANCA
jgi:pilus assembly protein FimV